MSKIVRIPSLQDVYRDAIPALKDRFSFTSVMQVPRLVKVVISSGVGDVIQSKNRINEALEELSIISMQRAIRTKARKSISNFKLREGMPIGVMVTLRRKKMYDFLYRLIHIAIPRVKDFRGIHHRGFDGHGNYSLGIREHIIFPEIDYDKISKVMGFNVTIVTDAPNDEQALALFESLHFPFRKQ